MPAFAFQKQNLHAFRHIDAQEHIWITNNGRDDCQQGSFQYWLAFKVFFAERLYSEIPLNDECAVKPSEHSNDEIEQDLKEVPRAIVFDLKHDELPRSEWIHCLQYLISMQTCNRKKCLQQERQ